jgi:hypothetical protein
MCIVLTWTFSRSNGRWLRTHGTRHSPVTQCQAYDDQDDHFVQLGIHHLVPRRLCESSGQSIEAVCGLVQAHLAKHACCTYTSISMCGFHMVLGIKSTHKTAKETARWNSPTTEPGNLYFVQLIRFMSLFSCCDVATSRGKHENILRYFQQRLCCLLVTVVL